MASPSVWPALVGLGREEQQVSRGSKYAVAAFLAAATAWVLGTAAVGMANVRWFTASRTVNMLDPNDISRAMADPTFTSSYTWGSFTLVGTHWSFLIPCGVALIAFSAVITLAV